MINRLMRPAARLPRLTIAQRVIDKIVRTAPIYRTETGESLVGLAIRQTGHAEPDLYVLDTIAPDESAIRRGAYFEQGDELQGDIFNWWYDNWEEFRSRRRGTYGNAVGAKWDSPLVHLGDWHKHPGTMIEPSEGDADTARQIIGDRENKSPHLLVVLATLWDRAEAEAYDSAVENVSSAVDEKVSASEAAPAESKPKELPYHLKIPVENDSVVRIDFWYMSRAFRQFTRLQPIAGDDRILPGLPPVSWHLAQPDRLKEEVITLNRGGYSVSVEQYDTDKQPPLEICLTLAQRNSQQVLILITQPDFPHSRPAIRVTPMSAMKGLPEKADLFESLWKASVPLKPESYPAWEWTPERRLIDLAKAVESKLTEGSTS